MPHRSLASPRRRSPSAGLALAAALALGGCARLLPGGLRCPANGGPEWREYRSRHFVVDTDLDRASAAALVAQLEHIRELEIRALVGGPAEVPGSVRVVAPAEERFFAELAGPWVGGYFGFDSFGESRIAIHPAAMRSEPEVIAHELAHALSHHFFLQQPRWFSEGVAQFLQTVATTDPRHRGAAGLIPVGPAARLLEARPVKAGQLLAWSGQLDHQEPDRHHVSSWLLYHWLWNERPRQLQDFQARLGQGEPPREAWTAAFPEFDPSRPDALERLDRLLEAHRRQGEFVYYRVDAEVDASFTETVLPAAEVHLQLLDARRSWPIHVAAHLELELGEALREDPGNPWALAWSIAQDQAPDTTSLRAALSARPRDWRGWMLLGHLSERDPDPGRREAGALLPLFRAALEANPDLAAAHRGLAWNLAVTGRLSEALPHANRAVDLSPWDANAVDTLAFVAAGLGRCPEALALQQRAFELRTEDARGIGDRLRAYQARCGESPADPW